MVCHADTPSSVSILLTSSNTPETAKHQVSQAPANCLMKLVKPPPIEKKPAVRTLKKWHKAFIVVFAVLVMAAVIAVTLVLTQQSRATGGPLPTVVITNLGLVSGKTDDSAKDACAQKGWIPTGVLSGNPIAYLCVQQSSPERHVNEVAVLRRLVVVSEADRCPSAMQTFLNPSATVFACLEFGNASAAIQAQKYVVDIMTTTEAFYNHDTPGWLTWPINLRANPEAPSVFVSVRYPIVPIVALRALTNVDSSDVYSACEALDSTGEWGAPGFVLKSTNATTASSTVDTVICVKRSEADINATSVLVDLAVVLPTEACPWAVKTANTSEVVVGNIKLCAEWDLVEFDDSDNRSISFVVDLSIYQTTEAEAVDTNISSLIPGDWTVIGDENSGTLHTFFLARKFEPFTLDLALNETVGGQTGHEAVASSVEASAVPSTSDELSFRVLQIADLHLTGNPDYPCSSGPAGSIRDSILESAWVISRELKRRAGISSSDNKTEDPLYNECREAVTIAFFEELLDIEKPDFVVFSGDNVHTFDTTSDALAISILTERVESRRIPWAAVFGNHDTEGGLSREEMLALLVEGQQFSHMKYGPRNIGGVGNYEVNVVAPTDGHWGARGSTVFRMYFLDSHGSADTSVHHLAPSARYEWIKEPQIEFYRQLAASHANDSDSVPAVMFFHIPIPEYAFASPSARTGSKNEDTASSKVNSGLFSALVEMGDVKATFVGHEHLNEYCYLRQGVQLCHGGCIGFGRAYGSNDFERRARVLEWTYSSDQTRKLRSWKRYFQDPTQVHSLETLYAG